MLPEHFEKYIKCWQMTGRCKRCGSVSWDGDGKIWELEDGMSGNGLREG